jgi:hypothetical protein
MQLVKVFLFQFRDKHLEFDHYIDTHTAVHPDNPSTKVLLSAARPDYFWRYVAVTCCSKKRSTEKRGYDLIPLFPGQHWSLHKSFVRLV